MIHSSTRVLALTLLSCLALYSYSQCCPEFEKVGQRDQFLYEEDNIEIDIYTDINEDWLRYIGGNAAPQNWNYNKFIRVRAWSNRSENTDNYIQFYWWIGDGNNPNLTQTYANGVGPKAGTYEVTKPMVGLYGHNIYDYIYYWTLTDIPTYEPTLIGYRIHDFYQERAGGVWVSPFSSYASTNGDLSNNNTQYVEGTTATGYITHFNSHQVTVDVADDGNIYIQIGGQECGKKPAVTIGRKTNQDVHKLTVTKEGNGTVTTKPDCENHKEGDKVTLTPTPDNSSVCFKGWTGTDAGSIIDNGNGTYSITMQSGDMEVNAVFGDCAKEVTDYIDTCSAVLPFIWRPWNNGGILINDISQNGIQDEVKAGGINKEDSIITLSLTLHEPQTVPVEVVDTFWQCDYDLGDGNWINIVVEDGMGNEIELDIPNAIGTTYETTEPDQYGCDSVTIHEVIIIPEKVQRLFEFCQSDLNLGNDNYINLEIDDRIVLEGSFWGTFSGDSIIRDTTLSVYCEGFDSITIDTIRIYPAYREPWNPGICADKIEEALAVGIPFYGTMITDWSQDGEEHYTDGSIHGCDSVIVLDLTPIPNDTVDEEVEIHAFPYTYKGLTFYSEEDTLFSVTPQLNGCNMYTKLIPVFADTLKTEVYEIACLEYVWNENNKTYTETGTDTVFLRSYDDKLDSIVVLHLTIDVPKIGIDTTATACSSFVWYGTEYTESGDYTKDLKSVAGCDSTVTLHLTVHRTYNTSDKQTVCRNSLPYIWEGEEFTDSGTRTKTLQTVHGCDSTVTFTLTVAEVYDNIQDEKKICGSNLPYTWEGETFNESGTITKTLQSIYGCDSTVTFTLTVMSVQDNVTTEETICSNELPYRWGEVTFTEAGTETQTFVSSVGCDSTVTLTLHVNPSYNETDGKTVCPDELPYRWQDVTFTGSGTQTRTLKTVNGCDSVVTFTLTVQTPTDDVKTDKVCDNRLPYTWNPTAGYTQNLNEAGTFSYTLKSSIGCDSIRYTLNLTIDRDYVAAQPAITAETCANDKALQILLNTTAGEPAAFDITFDERAAAQGLANISHETIPDDHIIAVPLPHDADSTRYMRPDDYSLTLTVYDGCDRRTDYPMMFKVLYPSWLIQQRWRDVLALYNDKYNGGYTFSVIRWFKNGVEMSGQGVHNSYVQMSPVLEMATYFALLTRADDGKSLRTCDFVPNLASPYYAPETEKIRLLQQNDSRHITVKTTLSGEYRVYDVTGKEIMTGRFGEAYGNPAIVFSPACANGAYIIRFFANDGTEDTKKWLIR